MAASMVFTMPVLVIYAFFNRYFIIFGEETPTSTTKESKWGRNRFFVCFCITKNMI